MNSVCGWLSDTYQSTSHVLKLFHTKKDQNAETTSAHTKVVMYLTHDNDRHDLKQNQPVQTINHNN